MNLTQSQLDQYRRIADELNLDGRDLLFKYDLEYINAHCNGIGPDRWPSSIRAVISKLHKSATIAAMIHDLWWDEVGREYDPATLQVDFVASNSAFEHNALLLANYYYGWYNPVRYLARHEGKKFRFLLDSFGWPNFLKAVEKTRKQTL